ncbi:hypothetical protein [Methylobacterium sp. CM6244]
MQDEPLINGFLAKREEPSRKNAELRERMAVLSNDMGALDRVLDAYRYRGELAGSTRRAALIVLFYRSELQDGLLAKIRKADGPLTARQLAVLVCQTEGKDGWDRRLLRDVTRRFGCALRRMRASRMLEG